MESILDSKGREKWALVSPKQHQFKRDYYVSNFGRMISKDKKTGAEQLLKPSLNKHNGFLYASMVLTPTKKGRRLFHKVVAEAFDLPKKEGDRFVIHKDGNNYNNKLSNLKYITQEEHLQRTFKNKAYRSSLDISDNIRMSKLNVMQVKHLKLQLKRGKIRKSKLAKMYNISDTQVARIERGENWGHIKV